MVVSAVFKAWLKANGNIKLSSDAAVLRIVKEGITGWNSFNEGITGWNSLNDFDQKVSSAFQLHTRTQSLARLVHKGAIFKNDNISMFMKLEKSTRGTSVESTVKSFPSRKDGRGVFLTLIANHTGDTKYRAILKKRMHLLQNIRWDGRGYPLENHVSNHRQSVDERWECESHITVSVPN